MRIDALRAAARRARADARVGCGDLTHDGNEESARLALERLSGRLGRPPFVVAGNYGCLERDDQLERPVTGGRELLSAIGVDLHGVRLAGVAIERAAEAGTFRCTGAGELAGDDRATVVASHCPVISRAARLAELGLAYPGDLINRSAPYEHPLGARPVVVLNGHIDARDTYARTNLLQLSAGALVEPPYELAIIDLRILRAQVWVRRRVSCSAGPWVRGRLPRWSDARERARGWTQRTDGGTDQRSAGPLSLLFRRRRR